MNPVAQAVTEETGRPLGPVELVLANRLHQVMEALANLVDELEASPVGEMPYIQALIEAAIGAAARPLP